MSKQWQAMSSMFAKRNMKGQLTALGFDEETAKRIEELIATEAGRQTERAINMMVGAEDLDPDAFYWFFGNGPELSNEFERELSTFLTDDEIAAVRDEVKRGHEKQLVEMADMTIGMMGVPNLTEDQTTRVRKAFAGKDFIRQQFVGFAELTRDRKRLEAAIANPKEMEKEVRKGMAPLRRQMANILTPQQMKSFDRFETQMIRMQQMQMKMMGGLFKEAQPKPSGQ